MVRMKRPLVEEVPGYSGRAFWVANGGVIRVTDLRGSQIGDVFALSKANSLEFLDTAQTRATTRRIFPKVGEAFWTNHHRPILLLLEDGSPGPHDTLLPPCDRLFYEGLGYPDHPNCRDNYVEAVRQAGIDPAVVPEPVNIFQNTPIQKDGSINVLQSATSPGDYIVFQAQMDLLFVLTACSVDVGDAELSNGGRSTELKVEVGPGSKA